MKTILILVGKTNNANIEACLTDYVSRIGHYMPFDVVIVPEPRTTRSMSEAVQKAFEGENILKLLQPSDLVVLLDSEGLSLNSVQLARWLEKKRQTSRRLVFIIGGPYGFDKPIYDRADEMLSLSPMTFSHQLVRLIFAEQLYRACTIIKGEPYHHA